MDTTNNEAWVTGDRVTIAEGPFASGEQARQAIADGHVIPLAGLDVGEFFASCLANLTGFELVEIKVTRERVTGEESDAELNVETFLGVREERAGVVLASHLAEMVRRAA